MRACSVIPGDPQRLAEPPSGQERRLGIPTEPLLGVPERFLEDRLRGRGIALRSDDCSQLCQQLGAGERVHAGVGACRADGILHDLEHAWRLAARAGRLCLVEHVEQKVAHGLGPLALFGGERRLLGRPPRLRQGASHAAGGGEERQRADGDRRPVAAHELGRAVPQRVGHRTDRLVREMPLRSSANAVTEP